MSIVTTDWLFENLHNVKIIDSSWHLPNQNRNAHKEYSNEHINNSIFFDIDKNSDQKTNLPHMLPKAKDWENIVSKGKKSLIIYSQEIYDVQVKLKELGLYTSSLDGINGPGTKRAII